MFTYLHCGRPPELCECRGGRPGIPVPNSPDGLLISGRKATLKMKTMVVVFVFEERGCEWQSVVPEL